MDALYRRLLRAYKVGDPQAGHAATLMALKFGATLPQLRAEGISWSIVKQQHNNGFYRAR